MATKMNMIAGLYETFAFETITVSTVKRLNLYNTTTPEGSRQTAKRAILTIESAQLRYRMDGENPSASVGHLLNPFDTLTIIGTQNMENFRAIKAGTNSSKISVSYEK